MIYPKKVWETGAWESTADAIAGVADIAKKVGLSEACAKLLYRRGYRSADEVMDFLGMREAMLLDPFLMKDMKKAAERILAAVENKESIAIYGDYDADGVSSVSLLFLYLEGLDPDIKLGYYIPDRCSEGYGMSMEAVDKLASKGVELIVTVDTGISAAKEVAYATTLGIDVVVTDHHECPPELPVACAVVDPHQEDCGYPFKELAGVGVAFKLIMAIERLRRGEDADPRAIDEAIYRDYADLAALGTVADVMPVVGENRLIITYGLKRMAHSPRPGVRALLESANAVKNGKLTAASIGFGLAPRINAAGRMDKSSKAVELLLLADYDKDAAKTASIIAEALCEYNKDRQMQESRIAEQVYERVEASFSPEDRIIVADGDDWHSGVIGIVASRVTERYHRPSIMITYKDSPDRTGGEFDVGKGSGRSIEGVNLIEAITASSECLLKFGGHELAAGLSVTRGNVDTLRQRLNEYMREKYPESAFEAKVRADLELSANDLTMKLANELLLMEPFGNGNPTPLFYLADAKIAKSYAIGTGKHLKLNLEKDGLSFAAVMFNASYEAFNFTVGERIDLLFQVDINEYNHVKSLQLLVREIRRAETVEDEISRMRTRYGEIAAGGSLAATEDFIPDRNDFARLYMVLRNLEGTGRTVVSEKQLYHMTAGAVEVGVHFGKFLLMLDVLQEMALCDVKRISEELLEFHIRPTEGKVDLERSAILSELKQRMVDGIAR